MDIARPSNAPPETDPPRGLWRRRPRRSSCSSRWACRGSSRRRPASSAPRSGSTRSSAVPMLREVRGLGTLVPEDIRWIPATTVGPRRAHRAAAGHVGRRRQRHPRAQQPAARTGAAGRRRSSSRPPRRASPTCACSSQNDALAQEAATASIEADYKKAALQVEANEQLATKGLVSDMTLKQSKLDADQLSARYDDRQEAAREPRRVDAGAARRAAVRSRSGARDRAA